MENDQAKKLRNIASRLRKNRFEARKNKNIKRIAITSGKGGVGKSSFSLNLGLILSKMNKKVLLIDADINLGNIDILLGLVPQMTLRDIISNDQPLERILIKAPGGLTIMPASSGDLELLKKGSFVKDRIEKELAELELNYEYILIDTGAGIGEDVIDFALNSDEVIVVTTSEPTAFTDAYASIKTITSLKERTNISVVINMVSDEKEGKEIGEKLKIVASHYLQKNIEYKGYIRRDANVTNAIRNQTPFFLLNDRTPASRDLWQIAMDIIKSNKNSGENSDSETSMFRKILN
ncbi:MAG: cobyrinic acid a,c-diamide synthase [Candidatus Cloacimonadota bacterium]|nr:MAG: cobyrinic acid a,c-diamide synthase [Candidatus Cloacimonadota bacterium]PIE78395.1 MAG: cobyrinic acid a,c-diamide synthase [Candidatus Delongbacteria bacterium]